MRVNSTGIAASVARNVAIESPTIIAAIARCEPSHSTSGAMNENSGMQLWCEVLGLILTLRLAKPHATIARNEHAIICLPQRTVHLPCDRLGQFPITITRSDSL